jgi:hypothetical protein
MGCCNLGRWMGMPKVPEEAQKENKDCLDLTERLGRNRFIRRVLRSIQTEEPIFPQPFEPAPKEPP